MNTSAAAAVIPIIWMVAVAAAMIIRVRKIPQTGQRLPGPARNPQAALVIFMILGTLFIVSGVLAAFSTFEYSRHASRAPGQIIDFRAHRGSKGSYTYSPIVRYRPPAGPEIIFESHFSTSLFWWPPRGAMVQVLYFPSNPRRARLDHFADLWMTPISLLLFGSLFVGITYLISAANRKKQATLPHAGPHADPPRYEIPNIIR